MGWFGVPDEVEEKKNHSEHIAWISLIIVQWQKKKSYFLSVDTNTLVGLQWIIFIWSNI